MDTRRLRSVVMIAVFDIVGPLVAYSLLRSAGFSAVTALVLSGVFPAAGVIIGIIQHHRVDALGVLVLAGIAVGAILGLVSHNTKLVLDEGSVPTAVLGLICLGSLATPKPLMYRLALEFIGPDTRQGREFTDLWQYEGFRRPVPQAPGGAPGRRGRRPRRPSRRAPREPAAARDPPWRTPAPGTAVSQPGPGLLPSCAEACLMLTAAAAQAMSSVEASETWRGDPSPEPWGEPAPPQLPPFVPNKTDCLVIRNRAFGR